MNNNELEIQKIENISTIKFYDIMNLSNRNNMQEHLLGLLIIYDGFHIANYCQLDPEFEPFFFKVKNQYLLEKDKNKIEIDEMSKTILESQILPRGSISSEFYLDKKSESYEHIVKNDKEMNSIFQLLFYHLAFITKLLGKDIQFREIKGYRKNWNLEILEEENIKNFPIYFQKEDHFHYIVRIANVFDSFSNLELDIAFQPKGILVSWKIDRICFNGFFSYEIKNEKTITEEISACIDSKLVFYKKDPILQEPIIPKEIVQFIQLDGPFHPNGFVCVKLPWNAYYMFSNSTKIIDKNYLSHYIHAIYFEESKTQICIKEHSNVMLECLNSRYVTSLVIDGIVKNTNLLLMEERKQKIGVSETTFGDVLQTNGEYKRKLANRTFYHIFKIEKNSVGPLIPIAESLEDYELTDGKILLKQFKEVK